MAASGSASLAKSAASADIDLSICRKPSEGGAIIPLSSVNGTFERVTVTTTRSPFAISEAGTPGAGSFSIGMCFESQTGTVTLDNNDWSIGEAFVTNGALSNIGTTEMAKRKSHSDQR